MDLLAVKDLIEKEYLMNIIDIQKVKNTYRIESEEGGYCVKVIKYQYPHFYFIFSAIKHLQRNGFNKIPEIIDTKDKNGFIEFMGNYAYVTRWIPSRNSNYDNEDELSLVSQKLGELHRCSYGFTLERTMNPRIGWYSWINVFETRCNEILDFQNRIFQKAYKSEFDNLYLSVIMKELEIGKRAIEGLKKSRYIEIMDKEVIKRGFCHHDYANHNVLVGINGEINIIDFDYCILDSHIHDLSSLLIRSMKDGKWNNEKCNLILNSYNKANDVYEEELELIKSFIRFPQGFWQIGLQYYWEQQPWSEEHLINKLNKYLKDSDKREEFIEDYFR